MHTKRLSVDRTAWQERGYPDQAVAGPPSGSIPTTPGVLSSTSAVAGNVTLTWTASISPSPGVFPLLGYDVYRDGVHVGSTPTVGPSTLTYTDTAPAASSVHAYSVVAVNGAGSSAPAVRVVQVSDGTIAAGAPGQVQSATHSGVTATGWTEKWQPPPLPYKTGYAGLFAAQTVIAGHRWLKINWKDLEPSNGSYNWTPITSVLNANPTVNYRLHIQGGQLAPTWLINSFGGPIAVKNSKDTVTANCGAYWTAGYQAAWAAFIAAAGAALDGYPNLVSVNMAATSLIYDEPFILGGDPASVTRMANAGLTADNGRVAMLNGMDALANAFPTTICEFPTHDNRQMVRNGVQVTDWASDPQNSARAIMNTLHNTYGQHVIITDYGLGPNDLGTHSPASNLSTAPNQYGWMWLRANLGFPIAWQLTASPGGGANPTSQNVKDSIQAGIDMNGRWVEHASYGSYLTSTEINNYNTALVNNMPTGSSGGSITFYRVYVDNVQVAQVNAPTTSDAITGKAPGTHYVTVRAGNSSGLGPSSIYDTVSL